MIDVGVAPELVECFRHDRGGILYRNREEAEGMVNLALQAMPIFRRAQELDPSIGADITLSEALEVLKRHGEKPGLSEEALDIEFEVPPTDD